MIYWNADMGNFILGVAVGTVVGYAIRALISRVRHRRFEENYGYNPRYPPCEQPLALSSEASRLEAQCGSETCFPLTRDTEILGVGISWKGPAMIKMSGDDLVQRLLVDDEILTQMVWETPLSLIGLLLWLALEDRRPQY
jgi:hypothetical protein